LYTTKKKKKKKEGRGPRSPDPQQNKKFDGPQVPRPNSNAFIFTPKNHKKLKKKKFEKNIL